jgi:hypothetical protein
MAVTSEQLEMGYKKIHRWCQFELRQFTKDAQLEVSQTMREAVKRLGKRPVFLEWVLLIYPRRVLLIFLNHTLSPHHYDLISPVLLASSTIITFF